MKLQQPPSSKQRSELENACRHIEQTAAAIKASDAKIEQLQRDEKATEEEIGALEKRAAGIDREANEKLPGALTHLTAIVKAIAAETKNRAGLVYATQAYQRLFAEVCRPMLAQLRSEIAALLDPYEISLGSAEQRATQLPAFVALNAELAEHAPRRTPEDYLRDFRRILAGEDVRTKFVPNVGWV